MVDLCRTKTCREALIFLLVAATLVMLASFNMVVNLTQAIQLHMLKSDDYWLSYPNIDYNQRGPKVIWLMSFPNSGNSFSTSLVRSYTNSVTATNYGENHLNEQGHSVPLHSGDQYKNGPFLVQTPLSQKSLIEKYVLTKTHCGGRCTRCTPTHYIETKETFKIDCLSARRFISPAENVLNASTTPYYETVQYEEKLVAKAIHIIRNPLDNIVSRYHLFLKMMAKGHTHFGNDNSSQVRSFTNDSRGFAEWCALHDQMYPDEEKEFFEEMPFYDLLQQIPCHADFFRYAQWHNHAFDIVSEMAIPSMILYYEDFLSNSFDETKAKMLQFIELEEEEGMNKRRKIIPFRSGKNYSSYYTKEQRDDIWRFLRIVCNDKTYFHIHSRYE